MLQNPFTYGKPITDPYLFIGRTNELNQILTRLRNPAFESSSIVGERRIGKTSLLKILTQQPIEGNTYFVYLDLQMLQLTHQPKDFWDRVLRTLAKELPDGELKSAVEEARQLDVIETFDLSDCFSQFDDAGASVVLLLDEFERVVGNQNFGSDFFYGLRSLATQHRLALITASYAELSSLAHSDDIQASPFFNIFATIHLGAFEADEADQFFKIYIKDYPSFIEDHPTAFLGNDLFFLHSLAGTHPHFLQIAGHFLFEAYLQKLSSKDRMDYAYRRFMAESEDDLALSWRYSTDEEKITLTTLAILNKSDETYVSTTFSKRSLMEYYSHADRILMKLERRSLVTHQNGNYALFSTVFSKWIRDELRSNLMPSQSYEEWLQAPSNKRLLSQIKGSLAEDVKTQLLPQVKQAYWGFIVSWLTNPATYKNTYNLLRAWLA